MFKQAFNKFQFMRERYGFSDDVIERYAGDVALESARAEGDSDGESEQMHDSKNIYFYSVIDTEDMRTLYANYLGDDSVMSATLFKKLLDAADDNFTIHINSPGGLVFEAATINSQLEQTDKKFNVVVEGMCFSAATFLLMPQANVSIGEMAQIGIHRAWNCMCGNSDDLSAAADDLRTTDETIMDFYMKRMKNTKRDELNKMMSDETFFTAKQCIDSGLADRLITDKSDTEDKQTNPEDRKKMQVTMSILASSVIRAEHQRRNRETSPPINGGA